MDRELAAPETFFGKYAAAYTASERHARGADLAILVEALAPRPQERALDVATGPGHTALALAPHVREVVGLDATEAMLTEARKLAEGRKVPNVHFQRGDAARLPFPDGSFDLVTSRRAPHHFPRIDAFLSEAARVLVPGGRLGISDMCPDPAGADLLNHLERLRDPTHARALSDAEWTEEVTRAGLALTFRQVTAEYLPLEEWLSPVPPGGTEEVQVRSALKEASPSALKALGARAEEGRVVGWEKRRILLVATKPAARPPP